MAAASGPMIVISYQGRECATVDESGVVMSDAVETFEPEHPVRRWAFCMAMFAHEVLAGRFEQPYSDQRARRFARNALLPDDEFVELYFCDDATLAECFNVPLEEINEKRTDIMIRRIGEPTP